MHLLLLVMRCDHCEVWGLTRVATGSCRHCLHHLEALRLELRLAHWCGGLGGATSEPDWLHSSSVHMDRVSHFESLSRQLWRSSCFLSRRNHLNHLSGSSTIHLFRKCVKWCDIRPNLCCCRIIYFIISA